jgi:hypothetical protein
LTTGQEDQDQADSIEAAVDLETSIAGQEKCIKQFALNASKNAKFHSSQQKASQFIAKNVSLKESQDSRVSLNLLKLITIILFFIFIHIFLNIFF